MQRRPMERSDVSRICPGDDAYASRFQQREVFVGNRTFRRSGNARNATGNVTWRNLPELRPGCDHFGIAKLLVDLGQRDLLVENHAIAVLDPQCRYIED